MCFTSPELRSASSYGHFTAAKEFRSQCRILHCPKCKRSILQTIHCPTCNRSILSRARNGERKLMLRKKVCATAVAHRWNKKKTLYLLCFGRISLEAELCVTFGRYFSSIFLWVLLYFYSFWMDALFPRMVKFFTKWSNSLLNALILY